MFHLKWRIKLILNTRITKIDLITSAQLYLADNIMSFTLSRINQNDDTYANINSTLANEISYDTHQKITAYKGHNGIMYSFSGIHVAIHFRNIFLDEISGISSKRKLILLTKSLATPSKLSEIL